MPRWLLPESISDILPSEARRIEELRRRLLDEYRLYGYELVMPPMVEYLESLFTGSGRDLELKTFKLIDQCSGRTMGIRPDMTPQVARIDAHLLDRAGVTRLSYAGSVLHTVPSGPAMTREPWQIGAELYGHPGVEADLEVIELLLQSLRVAGVTRVRLDVSHGAIARALFEQVPGFDVDRAFDCLKSKDGPALRELLAAYPVTPVTQAIAGLPRCFGAAPDVLERARFMLPELAPVHAALSQLHCLLEAATRLGHADLEVEWALDLADVGGYRYHTGMVFAAYVADLPNAIGRGGRYDNVGVAFGRARPATGFSLDLRELAARVPDQAPRGAIRAPWSVDHDLAQAVRQLRAAGQIVVQVMPGHEHEVSEFECDRELIKHGNQWHVHAVRRATE
jgi:ATP phosphoribosyltransferase regulatory subunit